MAPKKKRRKLIHEFAPFFNREFSLGFEMMADALFEAILT